MIERQNDRGHIAWDLETTGFGWNDVITVAGFWFPSGFAELVVNTGGGAVSAEEVESQLEELSGGVSVSVTVAADEPTLLEEMQEILFERFDKQYNRLVAYNAESWKSGFDLPFLRTRCFVHNFSWIFNDLQFADLWEPVEKRLNTTHTALNNSVAVNSLTGAHELLFDHSTPTVLESGSQVEQNHSWYSNNQYDPFADSSSAVSYYNRGDFLPILQHNLADVHRTWELGELVRAYVSPKDVTTMKL